MFPGALVSEELRGGTTYDGALYVATPPRAFTRNFGLFVRRHLCCYPRPDGTIIAIIAAMYAGYSVITIVRDSVESNLYPVSMLLLDAVFFLLCALHPSEQGLWLCTLAYFYVLSFSALLYEWWHVCAVVAASITFFATFRPIPSVWLWPTVVLGGILAVVLALHKHSFQDRAICCIAAICHLAIGSGNRPGVRTAAHRCRLS